MYPKKNIERVAVCIPRALQEANLLDEYKKYSIRQHWKQLVGEQIAKYSYIKKIDNEKAIVVVLNAVWMNQMFMYKSNIMEKINQYYGKKLVTDIQFVTGRKRLSAENLTTEKTPETTAISLNTIVLDEKIVKKIDKEIAILPEKLQNKMKQLRYHYERRKKIYEQQQYHSCPCCGRWLPPGIDYCFNCDMKQIEQEKIIIYRVLMETPWLNYKELSEQHCCSEYMYSEVKRDLIYRLIDRVHNGQDSPVDRMILAMAVTKNKPDEMTDQYIENIINKFRRKKQDVSAYRSKSNG